MTISIIIPTLNESPHIGKLIHHLFNHGKEYVIEILVIDGGSQDDTVIIAKEAGATVIESKRGRANQMNKGAEEAEGAILYFVHADTFPPTTYATDIVTAVESDKLAGCFRGYYHETIKLMQINSYCSRFKSLWCRGGDQSLFVTKRLFKKLDGYKPMKIMEEYDFIERLMQHTEFIILPNAIKISTRKYEKNNYMKVQIANLVMFTMYRMQVHEDIMVKTYQRMLG